MHYQEDTATLNWYVFNNIRTIFLFYFIKNLFNYNIYVLRNTFFIFILYINIKKQVVSAFPHSFLEKLMFTVWCVYLYF